MKSRVRWVGEDDRLVDDFFCIEDIDHFIVAQDAFLPQISPCGFRASI